MPALKPGCPWDALKLCTLGVFVKRDFRWYEVLCRRMLEVVREFSPRVEWYSIDEFFFAVLAGTNLQETAEQLRDAILRKVGVPVTVGIARTKTLAKLISDTAKPFGALALLDPDAERSLLDQLPVTEVSGIASRRAARLEPFGITTCLDFALANRLLVRHLLTITGEALWYELNGDRVLPLHTERPPHKMLSRGGSLGGATEHPERVYAWLVRNVERLVEELEFHVVCTGALSVSVQHKDGMQGCYRVELPSATDRFDLLLERSLPVWLDDQLQIVRWGNRRGQSRSLPCTAWTRLATLASGDWNEREPTAVVIPATMGLDGGVWFHVREGIRGVVVHDEQGRSVAYALCEPASHYYQVMTRGSVWMPVLVNERI